jgi:glycosyltransferase involved in cell wall biosynthesis
MTLNQTATNTSVYFSTPPRLLVAIPAYNEDRFIGSVVLKARPFADAVIVVDDGSTDATVMVAEAAGAQVLRHEHNRGKSAAVSTALAFALEQGSEVLVLLDGDGQHHPHDIPAVAKPILDGRADIVVGSRFLSQQSSIPRWRRVGQHTLTLITNVLSRVPMSDSQSGFRAFSRKAASRLRPGQTGFSVESEMQFQAHELGLKMLEVPIGVTYAEGSKRNPVTHGLEVLNGVLQLVGQTRPLFYFGVPGTIALVAGLGLGMWVVNRYETTQQLAVGMALITVILVVTGMLAVFNGLMLHSIRGLLLSLWDRD